MQSVSATKNYALAAEPSATKLSVDTAVNSHSIPGVADVVEGAHQGNVIAPPSASDVLAPGQRAVAAVDLPVPHMVALLNQGKFPLNAVIGVRYFGSLETMQKQLHAPFEVSAADFAKFCCGSLTFTSIEGKPLDKNPLGLSTGLGLYTKFYMVKSAFHTHRIYVIHEPDPSSQWARTDAWIWAQHLATADESPRLLTRAQPQSDLSGKRDDFVYQGETGHEMIPSTRRDWFYVDVT